MKLILSDNDVRVLDHHPAPVDQILLELGVNPLDVIVTRNRKLIPGDTVVEADDEIRITRVAHGG
jgi:sulfur carrier protein ThiS